MNFLASRMDQLTDTQMTAFRALCAVHFANDPMFEEPVPIWQLINMTYGLDDVIVVGGIESDEDIGEFVITNGLNEDVDAVPESSIYLLDKKTIGKLQRENDGGVILDGSYVVTEGYEIPEIYDGAVLPNRDHSLDLAVFRLLVAESPVNDSLETLKTAEWIKLPISTQEAQRIALRHNEKCMEDCVCYRFESAIPQIGEYFLQDMQEFQLLNEIDRRFAVYAAGLQEADFTYALDITRDPLDLETRQRISALLYFTEHEIGETKYDFLKKHSQEIMDIIDYWPGSKEENLDEIFDLYCRYRDSIKRAIANMDKDLAGVPDANQSSFISEFRNG